MWEVVSLIPMEVAKINFDSGPLLALLMVPRGTMPNVDIDAMCMLKCPCSIGPSILSGDLCVLHITLLNGPIPTMWRFLDPTMWHLHSFHVICTNDTWHFFIGPTSP